MNIDDILKGALVADAASLGLHWLYDQSRLASIARSGEVLFREPSKADYENCQGYFAHGLRHTGDLSHYGESALVVHRALADQHEYSVVQHRQEFMRAFGPCGTFIGYADRPTKALVRVLLDEPVEPDFLTGSMDDQLPALTCVPALAVWTVKNRINDTAVVNQLVNDAVSVTTVHEDALSGANTLMNCITSLANGVPLQKALSDSIAHASDNLTPLLEQAISLPHYDPLSAAQQFGLPCHMQQGLPIVWHILNHAKDYQTAVTDNLLCGGDSCGRAIAIGSVAGLVYGVPDKLANQASLTELK